MALKSFSIKIGSDTTDFNKGLKEANKAIKSTVKEGKALKENLKLDYSSKGFEATQKTYQHALDLTKQKAEALKEQLKYLEDNGGVDTDSYYDLQTKLAQTNIQAKELTNQIEELKNIKIENLTGKIDKLGKSLTNAGKSTAAMSATAAGLLTGMYKLASDTVSSNAELQDYVERLGVSAEALQKWQYIATQSGVDNETLYKSFTKLKTGISTLFAGDESGAGQAIEQLLGGINKLPKDTEQAFDVLVNAIAKLGDETLQTYYANEIFGERIATELIPLLTRSSGELRELGSEFESIGYLSGEQVAKLGAFDDELNIMKERLELAKNELGIAFLPVLKTLANFVTEQVIPMLENLAEWFSNLPEGMQEMIIKGLAILAVASPILLVGGKIVGVISSMIKHLPNLTKLFDKLNTTTGRLAISAAAVFTALSLITDVINNWEHMSGFQKVISVLGILTTVALGAAIAMGAFHSAWSMGAAVVGIIAGITAVVASVNKAKDSINSEMDDFSVPDITSGSSSYSLPDYQLPDSGSYSTTTNTDNSSVTNNITINAEGSSADEIVELITKKLAIKVQARS